MTKTKWIWVVVSLFLGCFLQSCADHDSNPGDPAPRVVSSDPADGAVAVPVWSNLFVTFSEAVDPDTVNATNITLRKTGETADVAVQIDFTGGGTTPLIQPVFQLIPDSSYTLTVSTGVTDLTGNPMAAEYAADFATGADDAAPFVVDIDPAGGATGVSVAASVTVQFSEAMNPAPLAEGCLLVEASGDGTDVAASVTYDPATYTATLDPTDQFGPDTAYTVSIGQDCTDASGLPLDAPTSYDFSTGPDESGPNIVRTSPLSDGLARRTPHVTVFFDEHLDGNTVTGDTLVLSDGDATYYGSVTYDDATRSVTMIPYDGLSFDVPYTATLLGTVADLYGNPMGADFTWGFNVGLPRITGTPQASVSEVPVGGSFTLTVPVNELARNLSVFFFDGNGTMVEEQCCTEGNGTAEGSIVATVDVPDTLSPGDYFIGVAVSDEGDLLGESYFYSTYWFDPGVSADNYVAYDNWTSMTADSTIPMRRVNAFTPPDLVATVTSVDNVGGDLVVSYAVDNIGGRDAGAFDLGFFVDPPEEPQVGQTPDGTVSFPDGLAMGATSSGSLTLPGMGGADVDVFALADVAGAVTESNEDNNHGYGSTRITFITADPPQSVYDGGTSIQSIAVAGAPSVLNGVTVYLYIDHSWMSDMEIRLVSPSGTVLDLAIQLGGSANGYLGTTFDDAAAQSITEGGYPFQGTFRPQEPFSALAGEDPNGTWQLQVSDVASWDGGSLQTWSITVW